MNVIRPQLGWSQEKEGQDKQVNQVTKTAAQNTLSWGQRSVLSVPKDTKRIPNISEVPDFLPLTLRRELREVSLSHNSPELVVSF